MKLLQGETRLVKTRTKFQGKPYDRFLFQIPPKIAGDSQFPFKAGEALTIKVDPRAKTIRLSRGG